MSKGALFLVGLLLGGLLVRSADAASELMFGSYSGAAKAITVTSTGAVIVSSN